MNGTEASALLYLASMRLAGLDGVGYMTTLLLQAGIAVAGSVFVCLVVGAMFGSPR